ncbi:MAG TPA: hypothetical protein VIG80_07640, partial [Bacillaceae bacterium]
VILWQFSDSDLYAGFIANLVVAILVSLATYNRNDDIEQGFDESIRMLKNIQKHEPDSVLIGIWLFWFFHHVLGTDFVNRDEDVEMAVQV